jgi:hypothetical protein
MVVAHLLKGHEKERRPWKSWATLPLASLNSRSVILLGARQPGGDKGGREIESIDVERTSEKSTVTTGMPAAFSRLRVNRSS